MQFVIKHDKQKRFRFAPLQSEAGKEALAQITSSSKHAPDSVILLFRDQYYIRSSAALRVLKLLGMPWSVFYAGIIIPRFIRDAIYDFISRNRYKWFGKLDECMIPTPEIMSRFLS